MKILVIGHAYIASINREKWKVFARKYPESNLMVLIPKNWNATLFDITAGDFSKDNLTNCKLVALDTFKSGNEVLYGFKFSKLIKLLRSFQPDIIHVEQGDNAFSYFQIILLAKIFCRNAKFTFFTWVNWKANHSLKYKLFWRWIEKFNLFYSNGAFVGNDVAGDVLRDKKFKKPLKVLLQLGVNENYFIPAKKIINKKYIACIGRMVEEKGIFILVDAFLKLSKEYPDWGLRFVGDGKAKKNLINYVYENKLSDRIEFLPPVTHEKIADILNEIEILVLPSYDIPEWKEQFGHILIEAMACKVAVIGSNAGYIPGVISDSGLIFEQKKMDDLVKKLKLLMENEELRHQLGEKGFKRFKQNFSYDLIAEKTYSFWKQFLK